MSCRRERQDFSAYAALIATPGDLATGFNLPANATIFASASGVLASTTALVDAGSRVLGAAAGPAGQTHNVGWLARGVHVVKHAGAPGTVRLYVRNGMGKLFKIGEG